MSVKCVRTENERRTSLVLKDDIIIIDFIIMLYYLIIIFHTLASIIWKHITNNHSLIFAVISILKALNPCLNLSFTNGLHVNIVIHTFKTIPPVLIL